MFLSLNRLGSLYFEVSGDRLDARFIRENGTIQDYFSIQKGGPPYLIERSGTASRISWNTVIGQTYTVDYKDNLTDASWTPLGSTVVGNGAPVAITNETSVAARVYRIRAD
jgi:hypothetical protein